MVFAAKVIATDISLGSSCYWIAALSESLHVQKQWKYFHKIESNLAIGVNETGKCGQSWKLKNTKNIQGQTLKFYLP